jgi:hypothetical protein
MLRNALRSACAVTLLACFMEGAASAQTFDQRTVFTFSGPVALPGVTLPAGQYLFRLADPTGEGKVVAVLSADGKTPYGMFFSLPAERFEPASAPEVRFMETAAGVPAAIKAWWYPGERMGYEFMYPKDQALRLAQGASQPVLTTQAHTTATATASK